MLYFHLEHQIIMAYEMDFNPHGNCVIFNNSFNWGKHRAGTGKDCFLLKESFRSLKYKVKVIENSTANEMHKQLIQENISQENKNCDSLVVCILTHGDKNSIHGNDGKSSLPYTTIWSTFGQENSTLRNKPKIFITQSCLTEVTTRLDTDKMNTNSNLCDAMKTCDAEASNIKFDQSMGTDHADIFFVHASVPGKLFYMSVFY